MIQTKMGPTEYGKAYNIVRTEVQERRRARKYKRSIQVRLHFSRNINPPTRIMQYLLNFNQMVADPEKAAKAKIRKHEKTRAARKEKSNAHREHRKGRLG